MFGDKSLSVESELRLLRDVFSQWVEVGVPPHIPYPKTLSQAVGWSCAEVGIHGVRSKRDLSTKNPKHGLAVRELKALIERLWVQGSQPPDAPVRPYSTKRRVYRTAKTRQLDAERRAAEFKVMLEKSLSQLHEVQHERSKAITDLNFEKVECGRLQKENLKLKEEVSLLKKRLLEEGRLRVVAK